MKIKYILPILLLIAAFPAIGQLSQINTSNRQTNVTERVVTLIDPGISTNTYTLRETNVVIGDTLDVAFGKVDSGWLWLASVVRTNGGTANGQIAYRTNSAPGYFWAPPPAGGGGTSNAIPIYSGGGTNLTVTNRFTLISTVPTIGYGTLTISNLVYSPVGNGYYTNTNGEAITVYGTGTSPGVPGNPTSPPWGTNTITTNSTYPWNGYAAQVNLIQVTNGVGTGWYYPLDPLHFVFVSQTNTIGGTNIFTSSVIFSGSSATGANQGYISNSTTLWTGVTDSSYTINWNGNPLFRWIIYHGADHNVQSHTGSAGTPAASSGGLFWDGGSAGGGSMKLGTSTNYTTNATVYWTYYSTNAWRFFSSTNPVTFSSPAQTVSATNALSIFYVTNCTVNPVTNSSLTNASTAYPNNFGTNVIFYGWYQGTNGYYFSGYIPGVSNIAIITWPATNITVITTAPTPPPTAGSGPCASYISATVGGVCKTLTDGMKMVDECASFNNATGLGLSHLDIAADGTATLVLFDKVVTVIPWTDSRWTANIPADACVSCLQNSPPLPCSFGGGSAGGGTGIPPTTIILGPGH